MVLTWSRVQWFLHLESSTAFDSDAIDGPMITVRHCSQMGRVRSLQKAIREQRDVDVVERELHQTDIEAQRSNLS